MAKLRRPWATDPARRKPGIILAWDMGSGKTAATLTAIRDLLDEFAIRKVLIVSTVLVAETVWPDEIEAWEHLKVLRYTVLRVPEDFARKHGVAAKDRRLAKLANTDTEIHIINKEGLDWLWAHFREGKDWPYDVMICDDVREAKSGKKRSKGNKESTKSKKASNLSRFGIIARARKHMDATIQLTGTPCPNSLRNLWGLAYTIDGGERLGTARTAFEQRWFTQNRYTYAMTPTPSAATEIADRLKDIMFSLHPSDYPDLPPMVNNLIKVKLPDKVLSAYQKFEKTLYSQEYDVEAVSAGVLHNKLLQFANGSLYREDGNDVFVHDCKLDALERIVEETNGEPLLCAYTYQFDLARIRRRFKKAVVLNENSPREVMKQWNAGKIGMLLAHYASAAHGLNAQFGGNNSVLYGLTSDLELYLQFLKRLHRSGQKKPVFNHHIIAKGTLDEDILPIYLNPKSATQKQVLDVVRMRRMG